MIVLVLDIGGTSIKIGKTGREDQLKVCATTDEAKPGRCLCLQTWNSVAGGDVCETVVRHGAPHASMANSEHLVILKQSVDKWNP